MLDSGTTARLLIEQLLDILRTIPDVQAEPVQWEVAELTVGRMHEAEIDLRVAGRHIRLLIEVRKTLYPRDVQQMLWRLRQIGQSEPFGQGAGETLPLIAAEALSPGAKVLLRTERVGYFDSGGSLFLPAPGAYLDIDKPAPKTLAKSIRSLFTGQRAQVLHALLLRPQEWFGGKHLADVAQVSPATVSQVQVELERLDWVVTRGQGPHKERRVREPAVLLDQWVKRLVTIRTPAMTRYFVPSLRADNLLDLLGRVFDARDVRYAISFEAAAQRYAPFLSSVSQVRCRLLAGSAADAALAELGARVVTEGANLFVIDAKSTGELLFREDLDGVWFASPIQVYLDLLGGEARAKELAEHLRKERIGF